MCSIGIWPRKVAQAGLLGLSLVVSIAMQAEDDAPPKAIPLLTGYGSYLTRVTGGQYQDTPAVTPLLLVPVGNNWLL